MICTLPNVSVIKSMRIEMDGACGMQRGEERGIKDFSDERDHLEDLNYIARRD
jgi:hypothetical protein